MYIYVYLHVGYIYILYMYINKIVHQIQDCQRLDWGTYQFTHAAAEAYDALYQNKYELRDKVNPPHTSYVFLTDLDIFSSRLFGQR
jgi:hypothetical protein